MPSGQQLFLSIFFSLKLFWILMFRYFFYFQIFILRIPNIPGAAVFRRRRRRCRRFFFPSFYFPRDRTESEEMGTNNKKKQNKRNSFHGHLHTAATATKKNEIKEKNKATNSAPYLAAVSSSVEVFRGSVPWKYSVEVFRGSIPWKCSVEVFRGSVPWKCPSFSYTNQVDVLEGDFF